MVAIVLVGVQIVFKEKPFARTLAHVELQQIIRFIELDGPVAMFIDARLRPRIVKAAQALASGVLDVMLLGIARNGFGPIFFQGRAAETTAKIVERPLVVSAEVLATEHTSHVSSDAFKDWKR
jgi:hypothetical protein